VLDREFTNERAYAFGPHRKEVRVTLTVVLDMVPGWGHQIEDHINKAFENPYVVMAEIEGEG